jgi:hypothetical protein
MSACYIRDTKQSGMGVCFVAQLNAATGEPVMATVDAGIPSETDIAAVEGKLATVYVSLPGEQRAVLATLIAAGLDRLDVSDDDTGGYLHDIEGLFQARKLELQRAWAVADRRGALGPLPDAEGGSGRSVLAPVLAFFRRATATPSQPRAADQSPA